MDRLGALQAQGLRGRGGNAPARELSKREYMEATMRFLDSTSLVMLLIMAGVFAPITVIHVLATSVFQ